MNPKPSKDSSSKDSKADKADKKDKQKSSVTEIPKFLDPKTQSVLLVEEVREVEEEDDDGKVTKKTKKRMVPVKFRPKQFPKSSDGWKAFCDYMIALWSWKKANKGVKSSDPLARKEKQVKKMADKLAELQKELEAARKSK